MTDQIKAVLLFAKGGKIDIDKFRICPETAHDHLHDYQGHKKFKPKNEGSQSQLTENQIQELILT